jgi:hypothetical protein
MGKKFKGFFHEQSRPDRDNFLEVHLENVEPDMVSQYFMIIILITTRNEKCHWCQIDSVDEQKKILFILTTKCFKKEHICIFCLSHV